MANNKDIPQVWRCYGTGTGGYRRLENMNERELAEREARQQAYEAMLARQEAYEARRKVEPPPTPLPMVGCVFAKSCNLPDALIDYNNPSGYLPLDRIGDYGEHVLLGGRETDSEGLLPLKKISGSALPAGLGTLALGGSAIGGASSVAAGAGTVAAGLMLGIAALIWPSNLGDSALYSDRQLRSMPRARTRVRLHVEQLADGTLKGYAFYTGKNRDWEMVDVVQFGLRGTRQVADLGDGVELIWTPAIDPADTLGIPVLEAAPQAPRIWVYPPTEKAANIIVDPIYPPQYRDFILVFPADSGARPLYVVVSVRPGDHDYYEAPKTLPAFPDAVRVKPKSSVQGGGKKRARWVDRKGKIYEWDYKSNAVEKFDRFAIHLGEFNHITGEQTGPAKPGRTTTRQ